MKIVIFIVIVLHGSVVVQLRCSGYIVYLRFREVSGLSSFRNF